GRGGPGCRRPWTGSLPMVYGDRPHGYEARHDRRGNGVPGVSAPDPRSYQEFWAFYLSQHLHPMTRRVHAGATATALLTGLSALAGRKWRLFAASPLFAYLPAFASHWIWEKN